jgi:aubergine-like protein
MEWGISFGENFVEVEAQCLPLPRLQFGNENKEVQLRNGRFRQQKDFKPVSFDSNNCMLITFDNLIELAKGDCNQMSTAGKNLGVDFSRPKLEKISNKKHDDLIDDLKKINYNDGKIIAIVVLDKFTKNLYPLIKDYLYTQGGLTSQFMLHDENPRGGRKKQNLSYYSAVLNQMVVKSHGELFRMDFSEKITKEPSMIIGIDSTKTKEGMKYVLSASFNRSFNRFYTDIKVDKENDSALVSLIKSAIDYFKKANSNLKPISIIIYRQGGNEKQTERLIRNELPKILKFLGGEDEGYEKDYKPKLSIFSVNKKTELKFFERHNGSYKNLPSGTVIDRQVISPELFEFYLQCPEVDRGTGSPVHFLCIYNNNESLTINDFEEITYKQSFYYWNWCGPIRIPAALKYAEVANTFCGRNIKGEVIERLKDSPYFI